MWKPKCQKPLLYFIKKMMFSTRSHYTRYIVFCYFDIWRIVWRYGVAHTKPTLILFLSYKAIRIMNRSHFLEPTNALFINFNTLKFYDLVEFKMAQIMYKAHNNLHCCSTQRLFETRESQYDLRGTGFFQKN